METETAKTKINEEIQRLLSNGEIHRLILDHSRDLISVLDTNFNFVYASPSHESVLGYSPNEIMQTSGLNNLHPDDREMAISMHREMVSQNVSKNGLFRFECKNGQWITLETRGRTLVKDGKIMGVVTIGRDITARVRMEQALIQYQEQLEFLAFHDPLTHLPNRKLFLDRCTEAIHNARCKDHSLAVLFLDCDDFKRINDTYGHDVGDEAIIELGRRISSSIRHTDIAARLSGDEFTVLLPHLNLQQDAVHAANRIIQSLKSTMRILDIELHLSVSIGIALFPHNGTDTKTLIRHADEALYQAKNYKRSNFVIYGAQDR